MPPFYLVLIELKDGERAFLKNTFMFYFLSLKDVDLAVWYTV